MTLPLTTITEASPASFPAKLECLFRPKRLKVLYGGRGAGRSWGIARALLLLGTQKSIRVLCAREFQNSVADSVHKVLADQIVALGLEAQYEVEVAKIKGKNGTVFSFEGIKNNTSRIKSYEGIDYCWVEEAAKVSRTSWGILIPTIRKSGSEIWLSFNPELETDYTYTRFVKNMHEGARVTGEGCWESDMASVVKMTWRDNPWFPAELLREMELDRNTDYDHYLNVWEGHCLQMLEGVVYARELRAAQEGGRICAVPYEPSVPVDTFWDLGRTNWTSIWFVQKVAMQYRMLAYYQANHTDIDADDPLGGVAHFIKEVQRRPYVYGLHHLPHDAKHKKLGMRFSIEEQIRQGLGPKNVTVVPKLSLSDGLNAARMRLPNCFFDEEKCADGLWALRHYKYKKVDGQFSNEPLHDGEGAVDGADAFRYFAVDVDRVRAGGAAGVLERLARAAQQGKLGDRTRDLNDRGTRAGTTGWMK